MFFENTKGSRKALKTRRLARFGARIQGKNHPERKNDAGFSEMPLQTLDYQGL